MERSLALICGAGVLPARMAGEARRQGWRVVAFPFGDAVEVGAHADVIIPSRITEIGPVLEALQREKVSAALFAGKFWMADVLTADAAGADAAAVGLAQQASARNDARLAEIVISTLAGFGITVLDQRQFIGDWLAGAGAWSARAPSEAEWADVRTGLRLARLVAEHGIGQTVVLKHGAVTAVEAMEGTTETIRRGTALGGPGAVVVKCVAANHDYRLDLPAIGAETIEAAARGGAGVVAFQAGRLLLLDREATRRHADAAGLAVIGVDDDGAG